MQKAWSDYINDLGHEEFVKSLYAMMPGLCAFDRPVCARFVAFKRDPPVARRGPTTTPSRKPFTDSPR
eukprot:m.130121 g.130121  ORF g.130121 m.130121 type:complete len:68 (-) comp22365_c0_seq4:1069-1272(-)